MAAAEISGIAPFFIVRNASAALAFYRDRLGFAIAFQEPEPDDIFFGIVQRGAAMIMLKDVGVDPLPNHPRDIWEGWARWDAHPTFQTRTRWQPNSHHATSSSGNPSRTTTMACAGLHFRIPTDTCCISVGLTQPGRESRRDGRTVRSGATWRTRRS